MHFVSYSHSSLLPISKDHVPISTPNSNLTSYNVGERMNEESPELLHLLSDFLPTKKKQIDKSHGNKIWPYAVHFDRSLPEKDPNDSQMESFLRRINMLYEEVSDILTKCLVSHLKAGCNFFMGALKYPHFYPHNWNSDESKVLQSQCRRKQY